jgi:phosphatidylserine/phosphatidylglycerophosphate/cardiolipin synthase-like enzyme
MTDSLTGLSDASLRGLVAGLRSRRIAAPFTSLQVARVIAGDAGKAVADELGKLGAVGFTADQIAVMLELLIKDRQSTKSSAPPVELVTSGPEAPGISNRDTSVVVRELFAHAQRSVLVVGYAVYQGQQVFETLARRMDDHPELDVRFFLNIARPDRDTTPAEILVSRFTQRFKANQWPKGCRLPEVYYDPRSLADAAPVRSSLHAKCIVVDGEQVFVSSANFTQAAQERNIEVGLSIASEWLASRLTNHFRYLGECGLLKRAF